MDRSKVASDSEVCTLWGTTPESRFSVTENGIPYLIELNQGKHPGLFLEHWDFVAADDARKDPRMVGEFGSFNPDYRSWTQREYGLRIGIFISSYAEINQ